MTFTAANVGGVLLAGLGLFINAIPTTATDTVTIYKHPWSCSPQTKQEYRTACYQRARDERLFHHDER